VNLPSVFSRPASTIIGTYNAGYGLGQAVELRQPPPLLTTTGSDLDIPTIIFAPRQLNTLYTEFILIELINIVMQLADDALLGGVRRSWTRA